MSGLEDLRDVVFIAPGDFDNDGLTDLCVVTTTGAALYRNVNGKFIKQADLATGSFRQAVWLDYDHDYDLDLVLIGDESKLLRNNGQAGFSDETNRFPFVNGQRSPPCASTWSRTRRASTSWSPTRTARACCIATAWAAPTKP